VNNTMMIIFLILLCFMFLLTALVLVNWSYNSMKIHRLLVQIATNIFAGWIFFKYVLYSVLDV